jgi:hypothetical protein
VVDDAVLCLCIALYFCSKEKSSLVRYLETTPSHAFFTPSSSYCDMNYTVMDYTVIREHNQKRVRC